MSASCPSTSFFLSLSVLVIFLNCSLAYKLENIPRRPEQDLQKRNNFHLTKSRHPTLTYFQRINEDNTYVDRLSKFYAADVELPTKNLETRSSATITVKPSEGILNGQKVNVSWEGVSEPSDKDWIGFYCPKNDTAEHYLDYLAPAQVSPRTWKMGYGITEVQVYNMRSECEFRYYRKATTMELIGRSAPLVFDRGVYAPLQGRLMLTRDPSQMRVMWTSGYGNVMFYI